MGALRYFRLAEQADYDLLKKLKNAALYRELGYELPNFFVMDNPELLARIQRERAIPEDLEDDLAVLCQAPLILRTDGHEIPEGRKHMLPRSDELRSLDAAREWLLGDFLAKLGDLQADDCKIVLIGHNFVPAAASAWALAEPDVRRVRIESLWGIPEGIYYFNHDVFDVDVARLGGTRAAISGVRKPKPRIGYKDRFIAPDADGAWIVHQVAVPADYASSIAQEDWIKEVAHTTRLIAERVGHPVVVMWFIGLSGVPTDRAVIPWYHDKWDVQLDYGALGKMERLGLRYTISTEADLERLVSDGGVAAGIRRILVDPSDGSIVRDPNFIDRLARVVKERGYVVELRGGVLSHVYYTLRRAGCEVVCMEAFGATDETLEFNKVVRDKVPAAIRAKGEDVQVAVVRGEGLLKGLRQKLVEEALEVADAKDTGAIVEELADLLEVVNAIQKTLGVTQAEVDQVRKEKATSKGAFDEGLVLLETSLAPPMMAPIFGEGPVEEAEAREIPEIPEIERPVNVDRRVQDGNAERILTFSLPLQQSQYKVARPTFDLDTVFGVKHPMRFEAEAQRKGAELRIRFRLANVPMQLQMFEPSPLDSANDEGKAPSGE